MDQVQAARLIGFGRLALGAAMVAAPAASMRGWIGADADRVGTQTAVRAFGAREVLLGFMEAHVASRPGVGKRTVAAIALCDAVDFVVTVAARRHLPASGVALVGALAGGSAVGGLAIAAGLD
jgi:hypothetical protein